MTSESSGPSEEIAEDGGDGDGNHSGSSGAENDRIEKLARSYRHHLSHNFDDRLREPLWQPVSCSIGDIGYMTPKGSFCVLYNVGCRFTCSSLPSADILTMKAREGPALDPPVVLPIPLLDDPDDKSRVIERNISMRNAALRAIDSVTSLTNSVIKFVSRQSGQVEA